MCDQSPRYERVLQWRESFSICDRCAVLTEGKMNSMRACDSVRALRQRDKEADSLNSDFQFSILAKTSFHETGRIAFPPIITVGTDGKGHFTCAPQKSCWHLFSIFNIPQYELQSRGARHDWICTVRQHPVRNHCLVQLREALLLAKLWVAPLM